jgi:small subunit ribosomal protein S5
LSKGGRTFSFSAIVVVGNEKGVVGYGLGKAKEVTDAISKGIEDAKKNMIKVPILHGTVPHEQYGRYGGARVFLKPAAHGTGVIAGGAMRAVLESVGVTDVLAKSKGSSNPHNVVKATIDALEQMRDAIAISQQRGISLDRVFNG